GPPGTTPRPRPGASVRPRPRRLLRAGHPDGKPDLHGGPTPLTRRRTAPHRQGGRRRHARRGPRGRRALRPQRRGRRREGRRPGQPARRREGHRLRRLDPRLQRSPDVL
ncbi:MAG: hypothetical protein AVDCRST_MAG55-2590, partial [uncultured Rubrobacteraceae bacterium]